MVMSSRVCRSLPAQVRQQWQRVAREALDLREALLVRADEVENEVTDAHSVEAADGVDDLGRRAERAVALGGLAKVHRVALAEREGRRIERLFVGVVDPREQQVRRAEAAVED